MNPQPSVSIVLPVYNCLKKIQTGLPLLITLLEEMDCVFEIIVIDDHSLDGSKIRECCLLYGCTYSGNIKNYGKGYTVKRGVELSTGRLIIFMDGDFPFKIDVIREMLETFESEDVDLVIGDRTNSRSLYPKNLPVSRKMASWILSKLLVICNITTVRDTQCGIKGFKGHVAHSLFKQLNQNGFFFDIELLHIAEKNGLKLKRIPVVVLEQEHSTVHILFDGIKILTLISQLFITNMRKKNKG